MKASLETSALFLSTTLELKNFVSPDLKFHCFLLPNFRSKDSSRSFSDLETTGPFQSTFQAIRKFSGSIYKGSGNFPVQFQGLRAKTFRTRKNFPDGNATMPRWFLCLWSTLPTPNCSELTPITNSQHPLYYNYCAVLRVGGSKCLFSI